MKVLMVCTVPTEKSGIPNVIFNLIKSFITQKEENKLELGYISINKLSGTFSALLDEYSVDYYEIKRNILNPLGYIIELSRKAKEYDIIHVHGNSATMVLEMIAAKIAKIPIRIAHSHNTTCNMKVIDKLARPLFYRLCNGRMACGEEAGKWLFGSKDFLILNNGIESQKFRFNLDDRNRIREELGLKDSIVIGHIGNFVEAKNHKFLISIFNEFHKISPSSKLLLLGDGPLRNDIIELVKKIGLHNDVIFTGSVDNPEDYMNAMDVIVMPSLFEGLPLTLIEEQANGLPIIASDNITKDANITNLVQYKSLQDDAKSWATQIYDTILKSSRTYEISLNAIEQIRKNNYDIYSVASTLRKYYNEILYK